MQSANADRMRAQPGLSSPVQSILASVATDREGRPGNPSMLSGWVALDEVEVRHAGMQASAPGARPIHSAGVAVVTPPIMSESHRQVKRWPGGMAMGRSSARAPAIVGFAPRPREACPARRQAEAGPRRSHHYRNDVPGDASGAAAGT